MLRHQFPRSYVDCDIAATSSFAYPDRLKLGRWIHIGPQGFIECKGGVVIGDGSILSSRVVILSSTHEYRSSEMIPYGGEDKLGQVSLGKAVWVGYGAMILPGVRLGDGCVVGAGAVVTRDVPEGTVVAGNPARPIGERNDEEWRQLILHEDYRLRHKMRERQ